MLPVIARIKQEFLFIIGLNHGLVAGTCTYLWYLSNIKSVVPVSQLKNPILL